MSRVLFVEGKDEAPLRDLSRRLATRWRLLASPGQGLFLLEAGDPGEQVEREAASLPGFRVWAFEVVAEGPTD